MSNELSITSAFVFSKNGIQQVARSQVANQVTVNGNGGVYNPGLAASTVDTALPLGGLTSLRWAWFHNLDATNNITIRAAVAGQKIATLLPGEAFPIPLDSSITAPSYHSNNGTPLLEYEIFPS